MIVIVTKIRAWEVLFMLSVRLCRSDAKDKRSATVSLVKIYTSTCGGEPSEVEKEGGGVAFDEEGGLQPGSSQPCVVV